ncbi:MAG: hypothetical protein RBU29_08690, partial [bacterium]|nr:hypothetical protein [bacterium]
MPNQPSFLRQAYFLLVYLPVRVARHQVLSLRIDTILKNLVLLGFGLGVLWAESAFFIRFWALLARIPMGLELLIPRFLSLASSFFISFLAYSSLLTTLSVLYHTSDHKVLLVSPIPLSLFLIQKSLEIALRSGITLIFLSLPPAVALGMQLGLGWIFY